MLKKTFGLMSSIMQIMKTINNKFTFNIRSNPYKVRAYTSMKRKHTNFMNHYHDVLYDTYIFLGEVQAT